MTESTPLQQVLARPRKTLVAFVAALGAMFPLGATQADTIAYEGFDYDTGTLAGQDGGDGFSGAWGPVSAAGTINVVAPGLEAGDLPTTGNAVYLNPTSGTTTSLRSLTDAFGADGTTTYISFVAHQEVGNRFFGLALFNNGAERLLIGSSSNPNWGITTPSGLGGHTAFSSTGKIADDPVLLVLRIDSVVGNDTLRLYVLPEPTENEPVSASATMTAHNLGSINQLRLGAGFADAGNPTSKGSIDEIRIATTWEDALAIPEPASLGLLLAGGLLMGLRGRQVRDEA